MTWYQRFRIFNDPWIYSIQRWRQNIPMRLAWMLPRKVALWAFIRVYAADGHAPSNEYAQKYDTWEAGAGR